MCVVCAAPHTACGAPEDKPARPYPLPCLPNLQHLTGRSLRHRWIRGQGLAVGAVGPVPRTNREGAGAAACAARRRVAPVQWLAPAHPPTPDDFNLQVAAVKGFLLALLCVACGPRAERCCCCVMRVLPGVVRRVCRRGRVMMCMLWRNVVACQQLGLAEPCRSNTHHLWGGEWEGYVRAHEWPGTLLLDCECLHVGTYAHFPAHMCTTCTSLRVRMRSCHT